MSKNKIWIVRFERRRCVQMLLDYKLKNYIPTLRKFRNFMKTKFNFREEEKLYGK
jgi:hypothetical protein